MTYSLASCIVVPRFNERTTETNMNKGTIKQIVDINPFDYMSKSGKVWVIELEGEFFNKYPTKKAAIADARKYGIKIS